MQTPPTTKQAMNPFMRVPHPKVEASLTACVNTSFINQYLSLRRLELVFLGLPTSKTVRSSLRDSSPLIVDFNLSMTEDPRRDGWTAGRNRVVPSSERGDLPVFLKCVRMAAGNLRSGQVSLPGGGAAGRSHSDSYFSGHVVYKE